MKKEKMFRILIILICCFFTNKINVCASDFGMNLEKKTKVDTLKPGDIIEVSYIVEGAVNLDELPDPPLLNGGELSLYYDNNIFELADQKNYGVVYSFMPTTSVSLNNNTSNFTKMTIELKGDTYKQLHSNEKLLITTVKLKVKDNINSQQTIIYNNDKDNMYCYSDYDEYGDCGGGSKEILNYNIVGKNTDSTLRTLKVDDYNLIPKFNPSTTNYVVNVDYNVDSVKIDALCNGNNCTVKGNGIKQIKEGKNNFQITVISESGKETKYNLEIIKASDIRSNDATLKNVKIINKEKNEIITYNFESSNVEYEIKVPYSVKKIDLDIKCNSLCKYNEIENYTLKIGNNKLEIVVTAENDTKQIYKYNIIREDEEKQLLKKLTIENYDLIPKFSANEYNYEIALTKKIDKLEIVAETLFSDSKVEIIGNNNLKDKNNDEIKIIVKGTDKKNDTIYKIKIIRKNNFMIYLIITIITIIVVVVGCICIYKKKNKKDKNKINIEEKENLNDLSVDE